MMRKKHSVKEDYRATLLQSQTSRSQNMEVQLSDISSHPSNLKLINQKRNDKKAYSVTDEVHQIQESESYRPAEKPIVPLKINDKKKSSCNLPPRESLDLTYALMLLEINLKFLLPVFIILLTIRYYTYACLIYVTIASHSQRWKWVLIVFGTMFFYTLSLVKISLTRAETPSQVLLKSTFNSMHSASHEYFEYLSKKKLIITIIQGLVPAELSFIFIHQSPKRKLQIYSMVNYIFISIESLLYYPYFLIYCLMITTDNTFSVNEYYQNFTVFMAALAMLIIFGFSLYLFIQGVKRKNNSIFSQKANQ